jgi:ribosomal protein L37AE/L43A
MGKQAVSGMPRAEVAEQAAASPCPFCNHRPIHRVIRAGVWSCSNCGERGMLMAGRNAGRAPEFGWPFRDTAVPMPLGTDHE